MKNFITFIVLIFVVIIYGCNSKKAEWKDRSKLKNLESMIVESIDLLESKNYDEYVRLVKKPSFLSTLSSSDLKKFTAPIIKNAPALIEAYNEVLKTEPRYMQYNPGMKPDNVDETVIFRLDNSFVAFDRIKDRWYHQ